jgi:hypothetical protein
MCYQALRPARIAVVLALVALCTIGAAVPARATPVTFALSGHAVLTNPTDITVFPIGSGLFFGLLSYDPALPLGSSGRSDIFGFPLLENSAFFDVHIGDIHFLRTGADGLAFATFAHDIVLFAELPSGSLPFTALPGRLILTLREPAFGPPHFDPNFPPENLDELRPGDDRVLNLIIFNEMGNEPARFLLDVFVDLPITKIPEPSTLGLLAFALMALLALQVRCQGRSEAWRPLSCGTTRRGIDLVINLKPPRLSASPRASGPEARQRTIEAAGDLSAKMRVRSPRSTHRTIAHDARAAIAADTVSSRRVWRFVSCGGVAPSSERIGRFWVTINRRPLVERAPARRGR